MAGSRTNELQKQLYSAEFAKVPGILRDLAYYSRWANPRLKQDRDDGEKTRDRAKVLRASLALLPGDPAQVEYLYDRLINAEPSEIEVIRDALFLYKDRITEKLWSVVKSTRDEQQLLCAFSGLAMFAPDDPRWESFAAKLARSLTRSSPLSLGAWIEVLRPLQNKFVGPLGRIAGDPAQNPIERLAATNILADCTKSVESAAERAQCLTPVLIAGDNDQFKAIFGQLEKLEANSTAMLEGQLAVPADAADSRSAERKARAAIALLRLGKPEKVWPLMKNASDETARSFIIHWSMPLGVDAKLFIDQWAAEPDPARRARLLLLGEYPDPGMSVVDRQRFIEQLMLTYETTPDCAVAGGSRMALENMEPRPSAGCRH